MIFTNLTVFENVYVRGRPTYIQLYLRIENMNMAMTWHSHLSLSSLLSSYLIEPTQSIKYFLLSSPSPKSKVPKSRPKGLGLTLKSHGP